MLLVAVKLKTIFISENSYTKLNSWTCKFIYIPRLLSHLSNKNNLSDCFFLLNYKIFTREEWDVSITICYRHREEMRRAEMLWHEHIVVVGLKQNSQLLIWYYPGYSLSHWNWKYMWQISMKIRLRPRASSIGQRYLLDS